MNAVMDGWRVIAKALDRVTETVIRGIVFGGCAHAPISEDPATFNRRTLEFLPRHRSRDD